MRRGSDWDDVLAVHNNCKTVSLWSTKRGTLCNHLTLNKSSAVTSCAISPCGNFGFLGYQDGTVSSAVDLSVFFSALVYVCRCIH